MARLKPWLPAIVLAALFLLAVAFADRPTATVIAPAPVDLDAVTVKVTSGDRSGHGSGVVVGDGTIVLTAAHVVDHVTDGQVVIVRQDGTAVDGRVVWLGQSDDIAIIKLEEALPAAAMQCTPVKAGAAIEVVGHPYVGDTLDWAHTFGHVVQVYPEGLPHWPLHVLIFDASVYRGNSGGPIFNEAGEVIAIVNAMAGATVNMMGDVAPYGFNLATPVAYLCGLLP
jgi:S1-C subfamily serine protease